MKRNILLSLLLLFSFSLMAQNLSFLDEEGNVIDEQNITIWSGSDETAAFHASIKNNGSSTIEDKVKKIEINVFENSSNTFCFGGYCYGANTFVSPTTVDISSNEILYYDDYNHFSGSYNSGDTTIMSIVRYVAFDSENTTDSTYVDVRYSTFPEGFTDLSKKEIAIYPNPVEDNINLVLNEEVERIQICDLLGRVMYVNKNVSLDIQNIDVNNYPKGIYFITFFDENGKNFSKKILKQ